MGVTVYPSLGALPLNFQHLMDQEAGAYIFTSRPWYDNFFKNGLAKGAKIRAFAVGDEQSRQALLIGIHPRRSLRNLGPRRLRFSHPDQIDLRAFVEGRGSASAGIYDQIVDEIARTNPRYDSVAFEPIEQTSPLLPDLEACLSSRGFIVRKYFVCGNWYGTVEQPCYDTYMAARPSRLRNTLRRRERRLRREAVGQFHLVTGGAHLATAYADYVRVTAASWQGLHPMGSDYVRSLLELAADQGALRLGLLYVDGKPAAGQIWLVSSGIAACYRLAYDERFERYSAGSLLTQEMFRRVIEVDKVDRIDFGIGDDPYKQDWVSSRRELWGVVGYNKRSALGLGTALWRNGTRPIRRTLRSLRQIRTRE